MSLFQHVELHSRNPKAAREFYSGVFGWSYQDMPMPNGGVYTMVSDANGKQVGGIVKKKNSKAPEAWVGYVTVPSVKRALAKAKRRKAKIVEDYAKIPGMGAYAIITDPRGGYIGLWENAPPAKKKKKKAAKKKTAKRKTAKKKTAKRKTAKKRSARR